MSGREVTYIVVHPYDIIRFGLTNVLKHVSESHVINVSKTEELLDYSPIIGNVMVLIPKDLFHENEKFLQDVLFHCDFKTFIWISEMPAQSYDETILSVSDSRSILLHKLEKAWIKKDKHEENNDSTELSKREIEVLKLIVRGYTNKEIAEQLYLSIHTVISHRKNITEKTCIKTIPGLTMYAILKKIIDISEFDPKILS